MNCSEFQHQLQQRLDGEARAAIGEIDRHLRECSSCQELQLIASRLTEVLGSRVAPVPPQGLRDQIVSLILDEMASQRLWRRRWRRVMAVSAVAAGLLLAVFVGYSWWKSRQALNDPDSNTVVKKDEQPAPAPAQSPLDIREAGTTLVALVNRTADETVGPGRMLLPKGVSAPMLPDTDAWQPDLEPGAKSLREAQDGVAVGFEPVTSSARRAVSLFLREVPSLESQKQ
jgi:hypothetical protein